GSFSAAGTMVGEVRFGSGAWKMGPTGSAGVPPSARVAMAAPPGTQRLSVKVCSQCSDGSQRPSQGARTQRPVFGLHMVPLVQMAMHPPDARLAAAAPMASAVITAAPSAVLGLPVLHPARSAVSAATFRRLRMCHHEAIEVHVHDLRVNDNCIGLV